MAIRYGFFNSLNGDRLYNADDFNRYFAGLISQTGVFENYLDGMKVSINSENEIIVGAGKALVDGTWIELDSAETITIEPAPTFSSRYDAVICRKNVEQRTVTIETVTSYDVDGAYSTEPYVPVRNKSIYEIVLADIYTEANSEIFSYVRDKRQNDEVCGFIIALIDQPDISEIYELYEQKFNSVYDEFDSWKKQQQAEYKSWFDNLTKALNVDTKIKEYKYNATEGWQGDGIVAIFSLWGHNIPYADGDSLSVYVNGLKLIEGKDFYFDTEKTYGEYGNYIIFTPTIYGPVDIEIVLLKSEIGYNPNIGYLSAENVMA